jgi:hypothetical protein
VNYIFCRVLKLNAQKGKNLLQGLGELMDDKMKTFARNSLHKETIGLLMAYKEYPIIDG